LIPLGRAAVRVVYARNGLVEQQSIVWACVVASYWEQWGFGARAVLLWRWIMDVDWIPAAWAELAKRVPCGYHRRGPAAVEPTALALAVLQTVRSRAVGGNALVPSSGPERLVGAAPGVQGILQTVVQQLEEAERRAIAWLLDQQNPDGSWGVTGEQRRPCWPTGWAVWTLWEAARLRRGDGGAAAASDPAASRRANPHALDSRQIAAAVNRAIDWLLRTSGRPIYSSEDDGRFVGHNTRLQGWPWVETTHSWVEPTAMALLALRRAGRRDHPRFDEAVRLLLDRQLPEGGWNYGNTTVLGNTLRPHVQPSGLALWALADEPEIRPRIERSIEYLLRSVDGRTTAASLAFAVIGLAAVDVLPSKADVLLEQAAKRTLSADAPPYPLALLLLAAEAISAKRGADSPAGPSS